MPTFNDFRRGLLLLKQVLFLCAGLSLLHRGSQYNFQLGLSVRTILRPILLLTLLLLIAHRLFLIGWIRSRLKWKGNFLAWLTLCSKLTIHLQPWRRLATWNLIGQLLLYFFGLLSDIVNARANSRYIISCLIRSKKTFQSNQSLR